MLHRHRVIINKFVSFAYFPKIQKYNGKCKSYGYVVIINRITFGRRKKQFLILASFRKKKEKQLCENGY